jgi:putative DNA methylase
MLDKLADFNSTQCTWNYTGGRGVKNSFGRQTIAMTWDFCETNPFNPEGASWISILDDIPCALENLGQSANYGAHVFRGSATSMPFEEGIFDSVVTDPPYYDNVPYADISDFFYVWLKRSVGKIHPEHFAATVTPKKSEAIADADRHDGSRDDARRGYERMMAQAFEEANRCLKPRGAMVVVYAHKTTLGWATLVDALRKVGFVVSEAWPLDTEKPGRLRDQESAALASSIFLVARKREGAETGNYEEYVKGELEQIVRERVETLWSMGVSGADLVIASVGAGLRAFTWFARVEYANGEEVPAERFLTEVETVVLETILARLSKEVGGKEGQTSLAGMDAATRFYVLWRFTYGAADLDAGEAIIFANGTHVELEGHGGLASGTNAILEKKKAKYRLRDYTERGEESELGLPSDNGESAPLVDMLHRLLWLLEHRPPKIPEFLADAHPSLEQLRLVCQALAGPALKGGELADISPTAEQSTLGKLLANWSAVMEGQQVKADKQKGQERLL